MEQLVRDEGVTHGGLLTGGDAQQRLPAQHDRRPRPLPCHRSPGGCDVRHRGRGLASPHREAQARPDRSEEGSMQVEPQLSALGVRDPAVLEPYLERRRYAGGERIMAQGTPGTECYLITGGEVRLEVERPDFDSDGVIAYLGPGMLCGEFSLLDGQPRSASAYADSDVTALALTEGGLGRLCADDPPTGLAVLRALGPGRRRQGPRDPPASRGVRVRGRHRPGGRRGGGPGRRRPGRAGRLARGPGGGAAGRRRRRRGRPGRGAGRGHRRRDRHRQRRRQDLQEPLRQPGGEPHPPGPPRVGPRPPDDRGVTEIASPSGWCSASSR